MKFPKLLFIITLCLTQITFAQIEEQVIEGDFVFDRCSFFDFSQFENSVLKQWERDYSNINPDTVSHNVRLTIGLYKAIKNNLLRRPFVMLRIDTASYYLFPTKNDFKKLELYYSKYDQFSKEGKTIHIKAKVKKTDFMEEIAFITEKPFSIEKIEKKPYSCKYED